MDVERKEKRMKGETVDMVGNISPEQRCREILIYIRKIMQAVSLYSRDLSRKYGLTGPQLVILIEISNRGPIPVTELARSISLSQATVTDILNRLEKKGLITKQRSDADKRLIMIATTEACRQILDKTPPPLQQTFIEHFSELAEWEQMMILSALRRVVDLMSAEKIDAAPLLSSELS
jgi:DNA-binding MarR family transcriptional regulator